MLAVAKITAKGQTTIPQDVRAALHVAPGDLIAWEVGTDGTATVRRVQPLDLEYLRAVEGTLSEWSVSYTHLDVYKRQALTILGAEVLRRLDSSLHILPLARAAPPQ